MEPRLSVILIAEVAGYSRLIGEDETGTRSALKANREELIEPKIDEHYGRVLKPIDDFLLAEFPSAVEAVLYAVKIQYLMPERNADVSEDRRLTYRIGINIGDIIVDGDDIYGSAVGVAARMASLANPGGICISNTVHDEVRDKLDFEFEEVTEFEIKNIFPPVRAFQVHIGDKAAARAKS